MSRHSNYAYYCRDDLSLTGFRDHNPTPMYSSVEGNGHKPQVEHYPFQGLDVATTRYDYVWLGMARLSADCTRKGAPPTVPAGDCKYPGERTPLGNPVALVRREGHDMLASPCGYCGVNIARCQCGKAKEAA